jgi:phosphoadenosine phosphosulfate reductase
MPLIENTLFGERDIVDIAIKRLQAYEPPEGYWLAFSGGKDSQVLLDLAKRAGVQYEAHMALTTVDPPELLRFVRRVYPDVSLDKPEKSMYRLIIDHGTPPTRIARYCCEELKERGGEGRMVLTGVRWAESAKRATRKMTELCYKARKNYLHPIIDWTDEQVWAYHAAYIPEHCQLYDEGQTRVGCVLCPMTRRVAEEEARWPGIAAMYRAACEAAWQRRNARGDKMMWTSGADMYQWWIGRDTPAQNESQGFLPFED